LTKLRYIYLDIIFTFEEINDELKLGNFNHLSNLKNLNEIILKTKYDHKVDNNPGKFKMKGNPINLNDFWKNEISTKICFHNSSNGIDNLINNSSKLNLINLRSIKTKKFNENLKVLKLNSCAFEFFDLIDISSTFYPISFIKSNILQNCTSLERLELIMNNLNISSLSVSESITSLKVRANSDSLDIKGLSNLKSLNIDQIIMGNFPNIEEFHCLKIQNLEIMKTFKKLSILYINSIVLTTLKKLNFLHLRSLKNLQKLYVPKPKSKGAIKMLNKEFPKINVLTYLLSLPKINN